MKMFSLYAGTRNGYIFRPSFLGLRKTISISMNPDTSDSVFIRPQEQTPRGPLARLSQPISRLIQMVSAGKSRFLN